VTTFNRPIFCKKCKTGLGGEIYLQPKNALDDITECNVVIMDWKGAQIISRP